MSSAQLMVNKTTDSVITNQLKCKVKFYGTGVLFVSFRMSVGDGVRDE